MFNDYMNMWMMQYFNALEVMNPMKTVTTLKTNDYVPFKENGLTEVVNNWVKTK